MMKILFFVALGIVISEIGMIIWDTMRIKNKYDCCYDYLESLGYSLGYNVFCGWSENNNEKCKTCKYNPNEREED